MQTVHALILVAQIMGVPIDVFTDRLYATAEKCEQQRKALQVTVISKGSKNSLVCRAVEIQQD